MKAGRQQINKQTDKQIDRHIDIQTDKPQRQTNRQKIDRQTCTHLTNKKTKTKFLVKMLINIKHKYEI